MDPVRNILVIVDPTAREHPAVDKAALLAAQFHARLELFICDTKASREARLSEHSRTRPHEPYLLNIKSLLETLASPLRQKGLDVTTETGYGDPLPGALIEKTRHSTAELVVKDTHHHSLARRTFITNTDWHLIRGCPLPLLLTKARKWAASPKVLAAVDPGHVNDKPVMLDRCILDHAAAFAGKLRGELHVLHAYLPAAMIASATVATPPMVAGISAEELKVEREAKLKELLALVADYHVSPDNIHLELGGPTQILPNFAEAMHADIATLGTIARSNLKRAFIGSTAEEVLERLPCDALIVKPPNFAEMLPF